jgi:plasmid stability protein
MARKPHSPLTLTPSRLPTGATIGGFDMLGTRKYGDHMPRMIQLRHVPDELYRTLKARAAVEGLSLSDYLLREVRRIAERPTLEDLRRRLSQQNVFPAVARVPPPHTSRLLKRERRTPSAWI